MKIISELITIAVQRACAANWFYKNINKFIIIKKAMTFIFYSRKNTNTDGSEYLISQRIISDNNT